MEMDKIQRIIFTESWQAYALGNYGFTPYGSAEFKSNLVGTGATSEIFSFPMLSTNNSGNALVSPAGHNSLWSIYMAGGATAAASNPLSAGYGPLNATGVSDNTAAGGRGFSIVPDPVRSGRKRLQFPATGATGRSSSEVGLVDRLAFRHLMSTATDRYNIGFVLRLKKDPSFGSLPMLDGDSTYLSLSVMNPDLRFYRPEATGIVATTSATNNPLVISNAAEYAAGTPDKTKLTADGSFNLHQTGSVSTSGSFPSGLTFEYDRDYHIEISTGVEVGNKFHFKLYIDGVEFPMSIDGTTGVHGNFSVGFCLVFGKMTRGTATSAPTRNPCYFLISDIIVARRVNLPRAPVIGANSRVWGESPSGDVSTTWSNPTDGTNASVVGAPMTTRDTTKTVELEGATGDVDVYSTDGSSLADYAGQVHAVTVKSQARSIGGNDYLQMSVRVGDNSRGGGAWPVSDATAFYYTSYDQFLTSPSGQPWSVSDINKLEVGMTVLKR